jgi:hypothetical protein
MKRKIYIDLHDKAMRKLANIDNDCVAAIKKVNKKIKKKLN